MAKKETIKETIIDAGICALVFSTVSYITRSCQNKNDLRKYYAEAQNNSSVAIIIDGKLYMYNNPSDMHFMPNDAYLSQSFNDANNKGGVNNVIKEEKYGESTGGVTVTYYTDIEYNINYLDSKTMVVYTYCQDESSREIFTRYILSNVTLDEDNNIIFNQNHITNAGYKEYKYASTVNSDAAVTESTQRTRSLTEE